MLIKFRGGALTKHDFKLVKEGIELTKDFFTQEDFIKVGAFGVIAVILILVSIFIKNKEFKYEFKNLSNVFIVLIGISLGSTFILKTTNVLTLNMSTLADSSAKNGFVYYFTDNLISSSMKRPFNYGKQAMINIEKELSQHKEEIIKDKDSKQNPNIIAVQLESLFDPTTLKGFTFSEDPMSYMRQLTRKYTSGKLTVPTIGCGTARS